MKKFLIAAILLSPSAHCFSVPNAKADYVVYEQVRCWVRPYCGQNSQFQICTYPTLARYCEARYPGSAVYRWWWEV